MHLKTISERKGDHVHERVFVGPDSDHLALAGTLVFHVGEWQVFGAALRLGSKEMTGHISVEFQGDEEVVRVSEP